LSRSFYLFTVWNDLKDETFLKELNNEQLSGFDSGIVNFGHHWVFTKSNYVTN